MVKENETWLCTNTVYMQGSKDIAFKEGNYYTGIGDWRFLDERGQSHTVSSDFLNKHFHKVLAGTKLVDTTVGTMGVKETTGKLNYELDFGFITQIAQRMSKNKDKYPPYNWQKLHDIEELKQALFRHVLAVMEGTYEDDGREFGHLEAIALNAMFLNYHAKKDK